MNKSDLVKQVIKRLVRVAGSIEQSSKAARQESIDAPSKMESRYDSTKSEQDWLAQALATTSGKLRSQIEQFKTLDFSPSSKAQTGSVVTLHERKADREMYFLLPAGLGAVLITQDGQEVFVTTPDSPVGKAIMGSVAGDIRSIDAPSGVRQVTIDQVE